MLRATVIMAKCQRSKESFGIRAEYREKELVFTWAFKLSEKVAGREGYGSDEFSGVISFDPSYPGCPHCESMGFIQCSCGKISCAAHTNKFQCPFCGTKSNEVNESNNFDNIKGGTF